MENVNDIYPLVLMFSLIISAIVGMILGGTRERELEGLLLGGLFGPIGWICVLLIPHGGKNCPKCYSGVPRKADRCRYCNEEIGTISEIRKKLSETIDVDNLTITEKPIDGCSKYVLFYSDGEKDIESNYSTDKWAIRIAEEFTQEIQGRVGDSLM